MIKDISAIVITKNASQYISECLKALEDFSEVIILDNGSDDNTLQIARGFEKVKVFEHEFIGFGPLRKLATSYTKNDWILSIDSDEILSEEAIKYIDGLDLNKEYVYSFRRLNHYNGRAIKGCGWYPDKVKRLFNKNETNFNDNHVHESVISTKVKNIPFDIKHYTCGNVSQMLEKMNKYTTIYANEKAGKKKTSLLKAIVSAKWAFIKSFIFKRGFLYGTDGLAISICNSLGAFFKHFKLLEKNKFRKNKDIYLSD